MAVAAYRNAAKLYSIFALLHSRPSAGPLALPCCPAETARDMAVAAYRNAVKYSSMGTDIVGIGCTCALATDREKRGEHKAFITTYTGVKERRWAAGRVQGAAAGAGWIEAWEPGRWGEQAE